MANDFATQYLYFVPTLKEIYDDQNLKSGTGELGAETISSIYKTIDIFKNDKKYISRIKMLRQLLDAQSDKSPSAKIHRFGKPHKGRLVSCWAGKGNTETCARTA